MRYEGHAEDNLELERSSIRHLLATYSRGIDRGDAELLASCYHEDATHDHGMFVGRASDFVQYAVDSLTTMERTMHTLQQSVIEVRSNELALGETAVVAYHRMRSNTGPTGMADHTVGARYLDRFERRDGSAWLIAHRTVVWEWTRIDPVQRSWEIGPSWARGRRDVDDPVREFLRPG